MDSVREKRVGELYLNLGQREIPRIPYSVALHIRIQMIPNRYFKCTSN